MANLSPSLSLIKELDHIYQVLIQKEYFPLALKALELKARLLSTEDNAFPSLSEMINRVSDKELETLVAHLKCPPKKDS